MIPCYISEYPQTIISIQRIRLVDDILTNLESKYFSVVSKSLSDFQGWPSVHKHFTNKWTDWLNDYSPSSMVIGLYSPKDNENAIFVIELNKIDGLNTPWGKRHHHKDAAYLVIYGFSSLEKSRVIFGQFRTDFGEVIRDALGLKNTPKFQPINSVNEIFSRLRDQPHTSIKVQEVHQAPLKRIRNTDFRNAIIRTKQAKNPTLVNISKSTGLSEEYTIKLLLEAIDLGIVNKNQAPRCFMWVS